MLPPAALALPRLHSVALLNPPAWRGFPFRLSLAHLEDVDLQVHFFELLTVFWYDDGFVMMPCAGARGFVVAANITMPRAFQFDVYALL